MVLVHGKNSFAHIRSHWEPALAGYRVETSEFVPTDILPTIEDVLEGARFAAAFKADLLVAVGGGRVIDIAKGIRAMLHRGDLTGDPGPPESWLEDLSEELVPLIAIPTTCGSGSEATPFAVIYVGKTKHSLDHPKLRPTYAIVDPALMRSLSPRQLAVSGMDALCQGLESVWATKGTESSRRLGLRAASIAWRNLPLSTSGGHAAISEMAVASNLAGRAISIGRTTAPHALSYGLTARFSIPHGEAVGALFPAVFRETIALARASHANKVLQMLEAMAAALEIPTLEAVPRSLEELQSEVGLRGLPILLPTAPRDRLALLADVNVDRLENHPITLPRSRIEAVFCV